MPKKFTQGYALLIGVDQNKVARWALPNVIKDVEALRDVIIHPDRCGYDPKHVRVITGAKATRDGILEGLTWLNEQLAKDKNEDATVVVFYTGHGWRDANANFFFIPYDVKELLVGSSALRASDFADAVAALKPKRLFCALDCCHASGADVKALTPIGAFASTPIPVQVLAPPAEAGVAPEAGEKALNELQQGHGRAVLSSSQADQVSWLRKDGSMSVFTYHVIEALTGHAQPAAGATEVLVSDVMSHVYRAVPKTVKDERDELQQPDYNVSGNFPIAVLLGGKGLDGAVAPDPLQSPKPSESDIRITASGQAVVVVGNQNTVVGAGGVMVGGSVSGNIVTGNAQPSTNKRRRRKSEE